MLKTLLSAAALILLSSPVIAAECSSIENEGDAVTVYALKGKVAALAADFPELDGCLAVKVSFDAAGFPKGVYVTPSGELGNKLMLDTLKIIRNGPVYPERAGSVVSFSVSH